MQNGQYIIGIDLGTTNSVVAYTRADQEENTEDGIQVFEIPQLVDAGVVENRQMLPSFLLIPGAHDVNPQALALPWRESNDLAVGEYARNRGAELPARLIASAKSWLCHPLVDRNQPILPWQSTEEAGKRSPVQASAAILQHIRDAWNHTMAADSDADRMENQQILLTVPASFDAVARELTVQAAAAAGLESVTLLEEPQAAFYAWIESMGDVWRDTVHKDDLVLVCDIGGGTSDFSLIQIREEGGELVLDRIAVGDHLLVGGDNIDLSLAYTVASRMAEKGNRLDSWQMRGLWHSCRQAKERLLSESDDDEYPLTVLGRGSSLIGGTLTARISRQEVDQVVLDGFFPKCEATATPASPNRVGLQEIGLSYEADPAVTHHLARFLRQNDDCRPTAVLFNGGVMKSAAVRQQVMSVLGHWGEGADGQAVREIPSAHFDHSVARGAAYYGLARMGRGIRIRYGLNKSYYIGIAASMPAVPGIPAPTKALCVAPFGMEEGSMAKLENQAFALVVGQPAKFDFLTSMRHDDAVGTMVEDWQGEIEAVTEIETTLDGKAGEVTTVTLEVVVTEVGTLELWCVSKADGQRWKLEFNVREQEGFGTS